MFNWIKNLFGLKQEAPKAVLDTTTNWPFPTAEKPAANDPAPVTAAPKKPATKTTAKKPATKTTAKKPAATRGRKPKA